MNLTQKETTLLSDLRSQEQLCIEKYNQYSQIAHDPELKKLFSTLAGNEQKHLDTINQILQGTEVSMPDPKDTQGRVKADKSIITSLEHKAR